MAKPKDKPPSELDPAGGAAETVPKEIAGEARELAPKRGVIVNVPRLKPKRLLN
jgi:hypothetical protein